MSSSNRWIGLLISTGLVALTLFSLVTTQDLKQKNEETLFLTAEGQKEYQHFITNFHIRPIAVGAHTLVNKASEELWQTWNKDCDETCHFYNLSELGAVSKDPTRNELAFLMLASEETSRNQFKDQLKKLMTDFPQIELSGVPYTNILLDQYSEAIKKTLFPALFAGLFILLTLYFRSLTEALACFFPGLMGAALSLIATKFFYGTSNLITSIIPLLIFVIELSLVLHIHETAKEFRELKKALKDKKEPIFLMVLTTFIGFGSLYFSELSAISDFGLLASCLILVATLFTLLWLWSLSHLLNNPWQNRWHQETRLHLPLKNFSLFWSTKKILIFGIITLFLGLLSLPRISIITDASRYFPKESGLKEKMDRLGRDYIGTPIMEILIPLPKGQVQDHYEAIRNIESIEKRLQSELKVDTMSSNDLVRLANFKYAGVKELPPNAFSYLALKGQIPFPLAQGYPLEDFYRITLLGQNTNVDLYEKIVEKTDLILKEGAYTKDKKIHYNGLYYHLMRAQKKMITVLFKSFFSSLLLISFLSWVYFRSRRVFLIFMVVNILPVLASFPLLWIFGLSFNIATVMTYSISLGLIVDSSFHIIHALEKKNITESFYRHTVVTPIVVGSSFLAICFFLFGLNDFLPIRQFGICLGLVILWGLLMDLKVLPTLYRGPAPLPLEEDPSSHQE